MSNYIKLRNLIVFSGSSVKKYEGDKVYISTGDAEEDTVNDGTLFSYQEKPSRANLQVNEDDIIVAKMKNTNKTIKISKEQSEYMYSTGFFALRANNKLQSEYLYYLLLCDEFISWKDVWSFGTTQMSLNKDRFKYIYVNYVKNLTTQMHIADFLNRKCSIIDMEIEKHKKTIKLAEEYRISLITNKIWNNASKCEKLKYHCIVRDEKTEVNEGTIFVGLENIESFTGRYIAKEGVVDSKEAKVFYKNDVLINKLRPYLTKSLYVNFNGICTSELLIIKEFKGDKKFLYYLSLSDKFIKLVDSSTYGTKMPRANWEFIKNILIPIKSLKEQQQITSYLDEKCALIDKVINYRKKLIEKLEEYKKSLIYEAVTGKIEV